MAEVTRERRHGLRSERPVRREREVVVEREPAERRSVIGSILGFFAKLAFGVIFAIGLIVVAIIVLAFLIF